MKYKTMLLAMILTAPAHAVVKNKVCYLDGNLVFELIQTSKKSGSIGISGFSMDTNTRKKTPVYGSGYFEGDKLYASLTYTIVNVPTFVFFDAYTQTGDGSAHTVTITNEQKDSKLVQVDCKYYFQ